MTDEAIRSLLNVTLGLDFEARDQGLHGTLFLIEICINNAKISAKKGEARIGGYISEGGAGIA